MKRILTTAAALAIACAFGSVDLDSPYFRFDFSSGSLSLTGTGEGNIGSSTGLRTGTYTAVAGPQGAGTAVHPGDINWGEIGTNALLNADWTFVMTIRPGTIEDGVILSLGRAPSGGKQISVCSSSDKSKIYVRVPYRTSSGTYTSEDTCAELTGLGDVTLGFHTLVIVHQYDSSNNGTLYFYWDGVAKGSYTMTCGLPFAGSSGKPGMQFCTTISSGAGTLGDYSYVQTSGSNFKYYAYYDVRLYTEMFEASDAVAYDTAIRSTFTTPDCLLHRWSFNGDFDDSIGGTTATTNGAVSFDSGSEKLCLAGGSKGSSYISLGSYPIPGDVDDTPFTIETWVTPQTIYNWSACFWLGRSSESDFGLSCVFKNGSYGQPHFRALNATLLNQQSETAVNEANCRLGSSALSTGTDYHIAVTVTPKGNGNGSTVAMYIHDTSGNLVVSGWATYRDWTTAMIDQDYFWLGQSCWNDYNPAADYDEVRVWRTALTEDQIVASIKAGPDTLPDFSVPSGFPSGITAIDDVDAYVSDGLLMHLDGIRNAGADAEHDSTATGWTDLVQGDSATLKNVSDSSDVSTPNWADDGYNFAGDSYAVLGHSLEMPKAMTVQVVSEIDVDELESAYSSSAWIRYPAPIGSTSTGDQFVMYYHCDNNNLNIKIEGSNLGKQIAAADWTGEYETYWNNGTNGGLFQETLCPPARSNAWSKMTTRTVTIGASNGGTLTTGGTTYNGYQARALTGKIQAARIYSRALTDDELKWNRLVDNVRFKGVLPESGVVMVATDLDGAEGTDASGTYYVSGSHTFGVESETVTVGGVGYTLVGYTLERFNTAAGTWCSPVTYDETSFAYTNNVQSGSVRLTWNWKKTLRPVSEIDVGDYVQNGLIAHFDGIRNAGATNAHDSTATTWKNLGTLGSAYDATKCSLSSDYLHGNAADGEWDDYGYYFKSKEYFLLGSNVTMGVSGTIQVVADYDCYAQKEFYTASGDSERIVKWPHFFGCTDAHDWFNVYVNIDGGANQGNRPFHKSYSNGNTASTDSWDGRYANGILTDGETVSMYASCSNQTAWVRTDNENFSGGDLGSHAYAIGTGGNSTEDYWGYRILYGKIRAVRVYNRVLTDAEFEQNRRVDEMRFFGGSFEDNADVTITKDTTGEVVGEISEEGAYSVNGSYTFTAQSVTNDSVVYSPAYTVETKTSSGWQKSALVISDSYTYTTGDGTVRLTWSWVPPTYTWIGASGGSFSDASNWDPTPDAFDDTGWFVFTNATAMSVTMDADVTVGTLFFSGTEAITLDNPDSATTNTLTVTEMSNSMDDSPTINCAVQFADTYYVECTSAAINFAGGATASCPSPAMTNCTDVSRALTGVIAFTNDWTPAASTLSPAFTVPYGSKLYGQNLYAASAGSGQIALRILEGGYAEFEDVTVDDSRMQVSIWGHLKVNGTISADYGGDSNCGIGMSADTDYSGVIEANGLRKNTAWYAYLRARTLYVGGDGIGVTKASYHFNFDTIAKTIYATDDFSVTSPERDGYPEDWRININAATTFNTQGHTVTWTAGTGGSSALIKDGEGTFVMSPHNNIMTGAVTVNAGTFEIGTEAGVGYGSITVASGATLKINASGAGAFTNAVTVADGATLAFVADGSSLNGYLSNVTLPDSGTVTIGFTGTLGRSGTTYTLASGMTDADISRFSVPEMDRLEFYYEDGSLMAIVPNMSTYIYLR